MNSRKDLKSKLDGLIDSSGGANVRNYWRGLEDLADTQEFQELVRQEFPTLADVWPSALSRRSFLGLMGASLALAGIGGCSVRPAPQGTIVPYVRPPEEVIPGVPLFFATTMVHAGDAVGLLVESHEGRPIKVEGNPAHPASLGATSIFHQASVLDLYDPARSQAVMQKNEIRGWDDAERAIATALASQAGEKGSRLRLLTEPVVSPTLADQIDRFLEKYPAAKWHHFEPIDVGTASQASQAAFEGDYDVVYDFTQADVVLSLDADFLNFGPGHLRYARDFISRRRVEATTENAAAAQMNRLYVVETAVSCTGAKADHRLAVPLSEIEGLAREVAAGVGVAGLGDVDTRHREWGAAVARDLAAHSGRCVVIVGERMPASVHALAHAINSQLGNLAKTVRLIKPVRSRPVNELGAAGWQSLRDLTSDMQHGQVGVLFICGGNPVLTAPAELEFTGALAKVPLRFHLSLYENETSRLCEWHLPEAHYLEAWSDARAYDGTASIAQPLIAPLYNGRSTHELLALLGGDSRRSGNELVRSYWRNARRDQQSDEDFDKFWDTALHDGLVEETAFTPEEVRLQPDWASKLGASSAARRAPNEGLELVIEPDATIYDGRYATNGWLQELPKPITKLTWDNAALMSPRTARELGFEMESFAHGGEHGGYRVPRAKLVLGDRALEAPVWIMPGHADGAVTISLGHGRKFAARTGATWHETLGFDAYTLRTSRAPWFAAGLKVEPIAGEYDLACTQAHHTLDNRDVIRVATLEDFRKSPTEAAKPKSAGTFPKPNVAPGPSLYDNQDFPDTRRKWGMVVDTTSCIGCNSCVAACQAENNIPVVGKEQVLFGREMHWIRVDRYVGGTPEEPAEFHFQPVACMHCEHAPCEYVCPVAATAHSAEGLNEMVYNRCVGTRFCSNNCPYKVRRFNFLEFADFDTPSRRLQYNPDVTVRSRGVMEKCSYCVQRIRQGEILAEGAQRPLRDGEVLTACQAACPTSAITFGDLNDPMSAVSQKKKSPLEYGLLTDLNTFPRTTYLAEVRNPNPEIEKL